MVFSQLYPDFFRDHGFHNQFIYQHRDTKKWEWMPWDGDLLFGEAFYQAGLYGANASFLLGTQRDRYFHLMKLATYGSLQNATFFRFV